MVPVLLKFLLFALGTITPTMIGLIVLFGILMIILGLSRIF
jgi:hypothetical protein